MTKNYLLMINDEMHGLINHLFGGKIQLIEVCGLTIPDQPKFNVIVTPVQPPLPVTGAVDQENAIHDASPDNQTLTDQNAQTA